MKKYLLLFLCACVMVLAFSAFTMPDEGEWLMTQIAKLPIDKMKATGLMLTPEQIYNPDGVSLTNAICILPGGTGSFVSHDGLIITNHHIAFGGLQTISSVQDDYLKHGFWAKSKSEEISLPTYNAQIVTAIKDITQDVLSAVSDTMGAEARDKAIRKKMRDIESRAKADPKSPEGNEYQASEMYNGVKYFLFTFENVQDVRLVYAPPENIGNYGGEVDNWIWPRHTGDFAFLRAYVSPTGKHTKYDSTNVPFHPQAFLPFSNAPHKEGAFEMIMGFPGRTYRYRTSFEVKLARDETLPLIVDLYKKRMDIYDAAGKKDRSVEIKYAATLRGLANTYKNFEGVLAGMKKLNLVDLRKAEEDTFDKYIDTKADLESKYEDLLSDMTAEYRELANFNREQTVMGQLQSGVQVLGLANRFRDYAKSFVKDSATGKMVPGQKDFPASIGRTFKNFDLTVDEQICYAMLAEAAKLPPGQQIKAVQDIVGDKQGGDREKALLDFVVDLYKDSHITSQKEAEDLAAKSTDDINDDKFVKFSAALDVDNAPLQARLSKFNAEMNRLRGKWMQAQLAWKGDDLYPDANRTLRFTYGTVKGFKPRDAVSYNYITSLTGVMEKESTEDPFTVPAKLHDLWAKKDFGSYADPDLKDIPIAFTSDLDITGGNSGSPIMNGKGELTGVAFDGNWEAVVGDYYFEEDMNRTISVDSRYVLFLLDKFSNAQNILSELVIKQ